MENETEEVSSVLTLSAADKQIIQTCLNMIKNTAAAKRRDEDLDFNLTAGIDHIERFLEGEEWQ